MSRHVHAQARRMFKMPSPPRPRGEAQRILSPAPSRRAGLDSLISRARAQLPLTRISRMTARIGRIAPLGVAVPSPAHQPSPSTPSKSLLFLAAGSRSIHRRTAPLHPHLKMFAFVGRGAEIRARARVLFRAGVSSIQASSGDPPDPCSHPLDPRSSSFGPAARTTTERVFTNSPTHQLTAFPRASSSPASRN
jgi:hypothetical protein